MRFQLFPPPATGVHSWLYRCAAYLRRKGLAPVATRFLLRRHVATSTFRPGRVVTEREIVDAVRSAFRSKVAPAPCHIGSGRRSIAPQIADFSAADGWPSDISVPRAEINRQRLTRVLADAGAFGLGNLRECSPVRLPDSPAPRWALGQLFGAHDVLCVAKSANDFAAKRLCDWTDGELSAAQFIVPNPLRKLAGLTKRGGKSAHCRDATGPRRYLIVESDAGLDADQQAKVIAHLRDAAHGALAAVVHSGGKSFHAWFRCEGAPATRLRDWFSYAVTLGADPRLWLPEQFVRLPDGLRADGARQRLVFLNPAA